MVSGNTAQSLNSDISEFRGSEEGLPGNYHKVEPISGFSPSFSVQTATIPSPLSRYRHERRRRIIIPRDFDHFYLPHPSNDLVQFVASTIDP
eukprot:scaffold10860_cov182-Amphora_coffeaeformis.AAC.5